MTSTASDVACGGSTSAPKPAVALGLSIPPLRPLRPLRGLTPSASEATEVRSVSPPVGATLHQHCLVSAFPLRPLWPSAQLTAPAACRQHGFVAGTVSVAGAALAASAVAATSARPGDLERKRPLRTAYGPSQLPAAGAALWLAQSLWPTQPRQPLLSLRPLLGLATSTASD